MKYKYVIPKNLKNSLRSVYILTVRKDLKFSEYEKDENKIIAETGVPKNTFLELLKMAVCYDHWSQSKIPAVPAGLDYDKFLAIRGVYAGPVVLIEIPEDFDVEELR